MTTGFGDNLVVTLDPPDATNQYVVRWTAKPAWATDPATTVELPTHGDERLVLGMAKRALVKDSARSAAIEDLIMKQDALLAFASAGRIRNQAPRVHYSYPWVRSKRSGSVPQIDPRYWRFY